MHPFRSSRQGAAMDEVSATHEVVMADLARLVEARDAASASACIERLRRVLRDHFQMEEERDGILDWIVMLDAEMGDRVHGLLADHAALRAECAALRCPFGDDGSVDEDAVAAIRAFAEHLRSHEAAERQVMDRVKESAQGPGRASRSTASEHVHLRQRFEQLERAGSAPALLAILDALAQELPPHFALEEADGGTFDELARATPLVVPTLEQLREEHHAVLLRLRELSSRLAALGDGPVEPLLRAATDLAAALRYHEQVEGRLIQEAAYNELGDHD